MSQCTSTYSGQPRQRTVTTVFCTKRSGHKGYHRGTGKAWDDNGRKIELKVADADSKKRGETWR